jgi:hypothetical protein
MTSWMVAMGLETVEYTVDIGWKSLSYSEQGSSFKIYIDPPARRGQPFTFYLPGVDRWREVFPEWAADRRDEIVARIKEACEHYNAEWVEG